jgi:hypothetical protein
MPESFFVAHRAEVISRAAHHRLTCVYPLRTFAEQGGLLSYGNDQIDQLVAPIASSRARSRASFPFRPRSNTSCSSISKTANALGLEVLLSLQQRADGLKNRQLHCRLGTKRKWCDIRLSPLSGVKRKFELRAVRSAYDPVKKDCGVVGRIRKIEIE